MAIHQSGNALFRVAAVVGGVIVSVWLLTATPSGALVDTSQVLSGGNFVSNTDTYWTSPGAAQIGVATHGLAMAESMVQLRMPEGVLSTLRVKITTQNVPSSGSFTVMVRKNGVNTVLTCQRTASGDCNGPGSVAFANNERLAIRVTNSFVGAGNVGYTYTLLFN